MPTGVPCCECRSAPAKVSICVSVVSVSSESVTAEVVRDCVSPAVCGAARSAMLGEMDQATLTVGPRQPKRALVLTQVVAGVVTVAAAAMRWGVSLRQRQRRTAG